MANTHQGHFPDQDSAADGHAGIAPVAQFPPNGYGLYDITGNVWQWTGDLYRPGYYAELSTSTNVTRNPQGPETSLDPTEPGVKNGYSGAVRFFAPLSTAPAISWARAVKVM